MLKARLALIQFVMPVVAILIFPSAVLAQVRSSFEQGLLTTYQEKPQILQGFYCGKKLKFDAEANLLDGGTPGPWTVCGDIHIQDILVKQSETVIKAHRIYLFYSEKTNSFLDVDLLIPKEERRAKDRWEKRQLEIRIAHPKNADDAGIRATIAKLLRGADKDFSDLAPDYWKFYLQSRKASKTAEETRKAEQPAVAKPESPAGNKMPHPRHTPDPQFSEEAREYQFQGTVQIRITVDANGHPNDLRIVRPAGLGLDERAAEAVKTWSFDPAKGKDGNPIAVFATVEVSFRLY